MMSSETQPLLNQSPANLQPQINKRICCRPQYICVSSKAAILIILWTAVVGTAYTSFKNLAALLINSSYYTGTVDVAVLALIPYVVLAIIMTFYPLSGFIADVCCGRFKTVMISLSLILLSFVLLGAMGIAGTQIMLSGAHFEFRSHATNSIILLMLSALGLAAFMTGLAGYQANYIQFGLDQLYEAPSEHLGLFVHYATWTLSFSSVFDISLIDLSACSSLQKVINLLALTVLPFTFITLQLTLSIIGCWKRHVWFYIEPGQHNPYRTVYIVLNFARRHKYPLQRSAFTYSDNYVPTRIDFAKERYGGPFTTEQVENVKTLLRILLLLVALGPVYVLQVPASQYVYPLFGFHTSFAERYFVTRNCSASKVLTRIVETGGLTALLTNILFPLYIWFVFSVLRKKSPKIFTRLKIGIVVCLLGVISMLIIDVVGHSMNKTESKNNNKSQCMFEATKYNYTIDFNSLNLHWSALIPPSVFLGVGPLLVTTTTLEFISAQSPHSMKGLLVGVFFAIQGFFQLLGITAILPLSLTQPWTNIVPSIVSCGSLYLIIIFSTGLFGFVIFLVAAKRYKYRERDDISFYQRDIEEVYTRYLIQSASAMTSSNLD